MNIVDVSRDPPHPPQNKTLILDKNSLDLKQTKSIAPTPRRTYRISCSWKSEHVLVTFGREDSSTRLRFCKGTERSHIQRTRPFAQHAQMCAPNQYLALEPSSPLAAHAASKNH